MTEIKLTKKQSKRLRKLFMDLNLTERLLHECFFQTFKRLAEKNREYWDEVYEVAELSQLTHDLKVDYATHTITAREKKNDE